MELLGAEVNGPHGVCQISGNTLHFVHKRTHAAQAHTQITFTGTSTDKADGHGHADDTRARDTRHPHVYAHRHTQHTRPLDWMHGPANKSELCQSEPPRACQTRKWNFGAWVGPSRDAQFDWAKEFHVLLLDDVVKKFFFLVPEREGVGKAQAESHRLA